VLRASGSDQVALIGAGVTVHQCMQAAGDLESHGIAARVIDLYSIKPADQATLAEAAAITGGRLVIAEDHYPQGGLGSAVLETLAGCGLRLQARQCAVSGLPGSGTPAELMEAAGISAPRIAATARALVTG
jgi:transketolase